MHCASASVSGRSLKKRPSAHLLRAKIEALYREYTCPGPDFEHEAQNRCQVVALALNTKWGRRDASPDIPDVTNWSEGNMSRVEGWAEDMAGP